MTARALSAPGALAMLLLAAAALLLGSPRQAEANGVPTPVALSYIDLSNWGPQDATGVAELIFAEGIVRISAQGLPRLTGRAYQGWLVDSASGDAISVGRFNSDAIGLVKFVGTLPPIANFGFDLFILTVEPEPDDAPQPSPDRTIGGYFSLLGERGVDGNVEGSLQAPGQLPSAGDPSFTSDMARFGALLAAMALSVFVGMRLSRRAA